jgi:hypothetical protein
LNDLGNGQFFIVAGQQYGDLGVSHADGPMARF